MSGFQVFQSVLQAIVIPFCLGCGAWKERKNGRTLRWVFAAVITMSVFMWMGWFDWARRTGDRTWSFWFSPAAPVGIWAAMFFCLMLAIDFARKDRASRANPKADS